MKRFMNFSLLFVVSIFAIQCATRKNKTAGAPASPAQKTQVGNSIQQAASDFNKTACQGSDPATQPPECQVTVPLENASPEQVNAMVETVQTSPDVPVLKEQVGQIVGGAPIPPEEATTTSTTDQSRAESVKQSIGEARTELLTNGESWTQWAGNLTWTQWGGATLFMVGAITLTAGAAVASQSEAVSKFVNKNYKDWKTFKLEKQKVIKDYVQKAMGATPAEIEAAQSRLRAAGIDMPNNVADGRSFKEYSRKLNEHVRTLSDDYVKKHGPIEKWTERTKLEFQQTYKDIFIVHSFASASAEVNNASQTVRAANEKAAQDLERIVAEDPNIKKVPEIKAKIDTDIGRANATRAAMEGRPVDYVKNAGGVLTDELRNEFNAASNRVGQAKVQAKKGLQSAELKFKKKAGRIGLGVMIVGGVAMGVGAAAAYYGGDKENSQSTGLQLAADDDDRIEAARMKLYEDLGNSWAELAPEGI